MTVLHRKPVDLTAWHLTDQAAMLEALSTLAADGWRGAIGYDTGSNTWTVELNADNPRRQVIATTGDWLVLDLELRKLSDADCTENYEAAE